jgi:Arc/MetJ-type ribon-helix-helix transcriptional regulator
VRLIAVRRLDINQDLQLSLWSGVECKFVVLSRRARGYSPFTPASWYLAFCKTCLTISSEMTPIKRTITFRIDDDLFAHMEALWERDGINASEQIRRALRTWLKSKGVTKAAKGRAPLQTRRPSVRAKV